MKRTSLLKFDIKKVSLTCLTSTKVVDRPWNFKIKKLDWIGFILDFELELIWIGFLFILILSKLKRDTAHSF